MAAQLVRMRVLVAGTNDTGSHQVGDVIEVDEPHAALLALVGFAERIEAVHVTTVTEYQHAEAEPVTGARRVRRRIPGPPGE